MSKPSSTTEKPAYTVKEASARIGVSARTLREWVATGKLAAYDFGAGEHRPVYRILASDLEAFISARRVAPTAAGAKP